MNEFIRVWCNSEPYKAAWLRVRASSIAAVHESRSKLSADARPVTFVIGGQVLEGSAHASELERVGLPIPELSQTSMEP